MNMAATARLATLIRGMIGDVPEDDSVLSGGPPLLRGLDSLNESILLSVDQKLAEIEEVRRAEFLDRLVEKMPEIFEASAKRIVESLFQDAPRMLVEYRRIDDAQETKIQEKWGKALNVFRMLWVCCHETGAGFSDRHFNHDNYEPPAALHAQLGLQARACRVALEVFALLRAGLGAGAFARARTLQEIGTISSVLHVHGTPEGDYPDLAERFLMHADVLTWLDAVEFQNVAPKLGYEVFTDVEMEEMRTPRDEGVARFGEEFGKPNGWAACLTTRQKAPRFKDLELLAGADHMRIHYSMASHEVHADAKSWALNHETNGEVTYRNTGPSPRGMADAAHVGLASLALVTQNTLYSAPDLNERPVDVIVGLILDRLLDESWDAFDDADAGGSQPY